MFMAVVWLTLMVLSFIYLIDYKGLPFAHSIRLLPSVVRLRHPGKGTVNDIRLFSPLLTKSRATLTDLDLNLHKSNSTFFSEADISRASLLTRLFSPALALVNAPVSTSFILAGVQCTFKREIRPFHKYHMVSKILTWNSKALFVATFFLRPESAIPELGQNQQTVGKPLSDGVHAIMVAKYVFRAGRMAVEPERVLRAAGFWSETEGPGSPQRKVDGDGEQVPIQTETEDAKRMGMIYINRCML